MIIKPKSKHRSDPEADVVSNITKRIYRGGIKWRDNPIQPRNSSSFLFSIRGLRFDLNANSVTLTTKQNEENKDGQGGIQY